MKEISLAIDKALAYGVSFYAYRLPNNTQIKFNAAPYRNYTETTIGFKIVPFDSYGGKYNTVIIPEQLSAQEFLKYDIINTQTASKFNLKATTLIDYKKSFMLAMNEIEAENLKKIVLSQINFGISDSTNWSNYFLKLERCYKNAFIFIYHTPEYGTWIGASPETLARYHSNSLRTMALAGTIAHGNTHWRGKEIIEQEFVSRYIEQQFSDNHIAYKKSNLKTLSAGPIDHLCTEFSANIKSHELAEMIVTALHPTPAICGLPQDLAKKCIINIENHERVCYGGYIGPVSADGFDYFVNLRSMYVNGDCYFIFTGGGLTIDSDVNEEWEETQNKAITLSSLL